MVSHILRCFSVASASTNMMYLLLYTWQIFYSFFKTLVGKTVVVELKNDLCLTGVLESVDQYLNLKLSDVAVADEARFPQLVPVKKCFIRGSTIRYIQIPRDEVDTELLQDAARKEAQQN